MKRFSIAFLVVALFVACGTPDTNQQAATDEMAIVPTPTPLQLMDTPTPLTPTSLPAPIEMRLTRADLGADWPFTTEDGVVSCVGSSLVGAVFFESGGINYGVNDNAVGEGNHPDIRNAEIFTGKNLMPIIDCGLALCQ